MTGTTPLPEATFATTDVDTVVRMFTALFLAHVIIDDCRTSYLLEQSKLERLLLEVLQDHVKGKCVLQKLNEAINIEMEFSGDAKATQVIIDGLGLDGQVSEWFDANVPLPEGAK